MNELHEWNSRREKRIVGIARYNSAHWRLTGPFLFKAVAQMSLSEKVKARRPRYDSLNEWLADLPEDERSAAEAMLSAPRQWTADDLLQEFRAEGFERGEDLLFGEKQLYRWRKAHGVTR